MALGVVVIAGITAFGLDAPRALGGFVLALLLTVSAMFAVGLWISAVARTTAVAGVMGQFLLYPVLFAAGLWIPREIMSPVLTGRRPHPLGASVQALQNTMDGAFPSIGSLLVLVGYTVVFGALAVRFFRWDCGSQVPGAPHRQVRAPRHGHPGSCATTHLPGTRHEHHAKPGPVPSALHRQGDLAARDPPANPSPAMPPSRRPSVAAETSASVDRWTRAGSMACTAGPRTITGAITRMSSAHGEVGVGKQRIAEVPHPRTHHVDSRVGRARSGEHR